MSTPSKAARELAQKLAAIAGQFCDTGNRHKLFGIEIQSALTDLLAKANIILCEVPDRSSQKIALKSALEPWKPGE